MAIMRGSFRQAESRFGLLIVLPAVITFAAVILYPFLNSVRLAFYRSTLTFPEPVFRGLDNFSRLFADPAFHESWMRTIMFVGLTTALTVWLGLIWAIVLNQSFRGHKLLRSLSLLPWVMPSTVTAFLWAWLLHGQVGLLNAALIALGVVDKPIVWLASSSGAMAAVVVAKAWLSTALVMTFFLAALQSLPMELVEAARIDGARDRQVIRHIVLPHLRNTLIVVIVLQAMGNLQQIDVIYAMTGGGPVRATSVLSIEVYRTAFQSWNIGLAAAIGVVWFITISIPAAIYLRNVFRQ
jgi:multiple sugar transport system permease protein